MNSSRSNMKIGVPVEVTFGRRTGEHGEIIRRGGRTQRWVIRLEGGGEIEYPAAKLRNLRRTSLLESDAIQRAKEEKESFEKNRNEDFESESKEVRSPHGVSVPVAQAKNNVPKSRRRKPHDFKFLLWWHYQSHFSAHTLFWLGINCAFWKGSEEKQASDYGNEALGASICVLSFVWILILLVFGLSLEKGGIEDSANVPFRAVTQAIFGVVSLANAVTCWGGYCALVTACTGAVGFYRGERGTLDPPKTKKTASASSSATPRKKSRRRRRRRASRRFGRPQSEEEEASTSSGEDENSDDEFAKSDTTEMQHRITSLTYDCSREWRRRRREGSVVILVWIGLYCLANLIITIHACTVWFPKAEDADLTAWVGFAKVAGKLLDFNCALLLIPVTRTLMLALNNFAEHSSLNFAKYMPLAHNIEFHKLVAMVILACAFVHVVAHYIDFIFVPDKIIDLYSYGPWITGPLICVCMFHIYSSAPEIVRRSKYLIFWYNHHFFILFYALLFVHMVQKETYFEQFFPYAIVPVLLYTGERILRVVRGAQPVLLKRVKWIPPVLELHLEPQGNWFKFKAGQYLYLNIPHIDPALGELFSSWHPFTISSAPGDMTDRNEEDRFVSLHIKVWEGGWTEKLKNYLELMNAHGDYPMIFKRRDEKTGREKIGKLLGPDGKALIRIDGPHSSPSQHYDEYKTLMLVGVGVGMTPCASILRSILLYKWTRGSNPEMVYFYWAIRHKEVKAYQWFVAMLTKLLDTTAQNRRNRRITKQHYVEAHIFVTSYDENAPVVSLKERNFGGERESSSSSSKLSRGGVHEKNAAGFSASDLWSQLQNPRVSSKEYSSQLALAEENPTAPKNRLSNLWIWNGRPNWDDIFLDVAKRRPMDSEYIGICYCGMHSIGEALQTCCEKYSRPSESLIFSLHKENF